MSQIELVKARRVRALDGFRLDLEFSDGSFGIASLEDFVQTGPMMAPLRDPAYFAQVFLEMGVPTWPNGCDVDPTALRMRLKAEGALRRPIPAE
ncbi:MAG TPA: DUF2442 domain-containing protein [Caulobacteraceae bacterium]|nr:DUF2442 domain-containing protein [Caulobacteraceae bacterium]